jgi:hypothetical protein
LPTIIASLLITSLLLLVAGLLWLNKHRLPQFIHKIPFIIEVLSFFFWILAFRELVLLIGLIPGFGLENQKFWPIYVESFGLSNIRSLTAWLYLFLALAGVICVFLMYKRILNTRISLFFGIVIFVLMWNVTTLNALQGGIVHGFTYPISRGEEYIQDIGRFDSARDVIGQYNQVQATLHNRAHTHPFGPVLSFYFLNKLFSGNLFLTALLMSILSCLIVLPIYLLFKQLKLPERVCRTLVLIFTFIPGIIIYFGTSIDGIIALLLITTIATFICALVRKNMVLAMISGVAAYAGLLMTFLGLFVIATMVIWFLVYNRLIIKRNPFSNIQYLMAALLVPLALLIVTRYLWGFDYIQCFLTASRFTNPEGFRLIANPLNYITTRLEDVWDILFCFGVVCSVLIYRTIRSIKSGTAISSPTLFGLIGIFVALVLFLSGSSETGETGRVYMFIVPYLLVLLCDQFKGTVDHEKVSKAILGWLFVQGVFMQSIFSFYW